jgi:hypothetical protein
VHSVPGARQLGCELQPHRALRQERGCPSPQATQSMVHCTLLARCAVIGAGYSSQRHTCERFRWEHTQYMSKGPSCFCFSHTLLSYGDAAPNSWPLLPGLELRRLSSHTGEGDDLDAWVASLAAQQPRVGSRQAQRQASVMAGGLSATQAAALELQVLSAVSNVDGSQLPLSWPAGSVGCPVKSNVLGSPRHCGRPDVEM